MDRQFDEELNSLKEKLLKMAAVVEESIDLSIRSLKERKEPLANEVLKREEAINLMEIDIDELAMKLLALKQPMAVDLRFITSAWKMSSELERIGDLAVNIAERSLDLLKYPLLKPLIDIPRMASLAQNMVRDGINSFINKDAVLAKDVCERDDEVDHLNDQIFRELITYTIENPKNIRLTVGLILVGRHLERIADHATNISEDVYYYVKGRSIKHHLEERRREQAREGE